MHEAATSVLIDAAHKGLATTPALQTGQTAPRWNPWRLMPLLGPLVLFIIWDFVVRFKLIPPILLPSPWNTLSTLFMGMAGGSLSGDFAYTLIRTLEAFSIAAVVGVPLGVLLGSNEGAYRSVEFVIDFFRSTPSSALIPLFLMIFGVSDINKVAIAAFGALLIVLFNSAYGVINARKQRVMAAKVMGATRWQIFKDVLIWESLQPTFVGLRSAVSMSLVIVIVAEMFIGSERDLNRYPYELSGGQQQTASIMRALAPKPEVLFLDEPFSALDFEMTLFIREKLQDVFMQTGTTMLLVSHDLEEAVYLADQILLLTKRPTHVAEILNYNDPRPRTIETLTQPSFIDAKKLSLEIFQREVRK